MKNVVIVLMLFMASACLANAKAMSAEEIIRLSENAKGAGMEGFTANLHIRADEGGSITERWLLLKVGGNNNDTSNQSVVEFSQPRKYKGQMILMAKGNMWFLRRGLSKPVPISPRQRMMGGAANGDIATTNYINYYDHKILRSEKLDGKDYFVMELKATSRLATYSRILYWISTNNYLGQKAEFFTASGKLFKTAEFEYKNSISVNDEKMPFLSSMTIHDEIQKGDFTVMTYDDIAIKSIPPSDFNVNLLVR